MPILMLFPQVNCAAEGSNGFQAGSMPDEHDVVFFVAGVERIVSAFDEDFGPLDETGSEEPRDHA